MSLNTCNSLIHIQYSLKRENVCCSTYEIPQEVCLKINSNETYKRSKYYIESNLWSEDEENIPFLFTNNQF